MAVQIDKVVVRKGLKRQREPYWKRETAGKYVGYRIMPRSPIGTWLARFYDGDRYEYKALGDFGLLAENERYDAAKRAAIDWWRHLEMGGTNASGTVTDACKAYVDKLRQDNSENAAKDAEARFRRLVNDDPIGKLLLTKLTSRQVAEWKKRALARGGTRGSFNRNATAFRAALNLALERRDVASDHSWTVELRPFKDADGRRELYLTMAARRLLISKASAEVQPLLTAMALLPCRPGELAGLRVEHLDDHQGTLRVVGKTGTRDIPLPTQALQQLRACAKSKLPSAWLIARDEGGQWLKNAWAEAIRGAARVAKLSTGTCAYTLRHSAITDLVTSGLDLFTVAKISGTSVSMIEKHYGKLRQQIARNAMEKLSL